MHPLILYDLESRIVPSPIRSHSCIHPGHLSFCIKVRGTSSACSEVSASMSNMLHSRQAPTPDKRYTNLFPGKILLHRFNEQRLEKIVSFSEFSEIVDRCWEDVESKLCHVHNGKAYCFGRAFYPCAVPMLSPAEFPYPLPYKLSENRREAKRVVHRILIQRLFWTCWRATQAIRGKPVVITIKAMREFNVCPVPQILYRSWIRAMWMHTKMYYNVVDFYEHFFYISISSRQHPYMICDDGGTVPEDNDGEELPKLIRRIADPIFSCRPFFKDGPEHREFTKFNRIATPIMDGNKENRTGSNPVTPAKRTWPGNNHMAPSAKVARVPIDDSADDDVVSVDYF